VATVCRKVGERIKLHNEELHTEISGSQDRKYEDDSLLGYCTM
jgi:hypothetical protein